MPNWLLFIFDCISIILLSFCALTSVSSMISEETKDKRVNAFGLLLCTILVMVTLILHF